MKTYRSKVSGLFVGRQADQVDGEEYETVEVPTAKDELIEFINSLQAAPAIPSDAAPVPAPPTSPRPQPSDADVIYAKFRADVSAGRVDLEDTLWKAPLDMCLRLASIVYERTFEHYVKEKQNANRSKSI